MNKPAARVVSVTPLSLERDSRTLKIAASFVRWGFISIVVENRPSSAAAKEEWQRLHGIKVVTLPGGRATAEGAVNGAGDAARAPAESDTFSQFRARILRVMPPFVAEIAHYGLFRLIYELLRPWLHAHCVPPADVYYLHEYRLFPMLKRVIRRQNGTPLIYDAHDFYPEVEVQETESLVRRHLLKPHLEAMERECIAAANAVVTVSDGVRELMQAQFGCHAIVIRNCHDRRLDLMVQNDLKSRLGLAKDTFLIVAVGNRKPGLAVDTILEAMSVLPASFHVSFVGRYHELTATGAQMRGLANRVHLLGGVHPNEIVPTLYGADLAVVPYVAVTRNVASILPNGFFQSASANIPLVLPMLADIEESVGSDGMVWWSDFSTGAGLAETIKEIVQCRDGIDEKVSKMRSLSEKLSWEREETKLLDQVGQLLVQMAKV